MKGILGAAALLLLPNLSGCTSVFGDVRNTINYALETAKTNDADLSPADIEAFPYSAQYIRRDGSSRVLVVLGYIDTVGTEKQYSWISRDSITVVTENGRVIKTLGQKAEISAAKLGQHDLVYVNNRENDPLRCIIQSHTNTSTCNTRWERQIDYVDRDRQRSENVVSEFRIVSGPELMGFPAGEYNVYHVVETGHFTASGVAFENDFYIEADGHVARSKQMLIPKSEYITLIQVKWVGRDSAGAQ